MDRFADRDMLMRYHWGLAAGHVYTHALAIGTEHAMDLETTTEHTQDFAENTTGGARAGSPDLNESASDVEQAELEFGDQEDDDWEDRPLGDDNSQVDPEDLSDDDAFAAMDEMYGLSTHCN